MMAASAFRMDSSYPRTLISTGSPSGATLRTVNSVPLPGVFDLYNHIAVVLGNDGHQFTEHKTELAEMAPCFVIAADFANFVVFSGFSEDQGNHRFAPLYFDRR